MAESKPMFYSFDESREQIEDHLESFRLFCNIQNYKHHKKQQILITSLSTELYAKLIASVPPKEVISWCYGEIENILNKVFYETLKCKTERYTFHKITTYCPAHKRAHPPY